MSKEKLSFENVPGALEQLIEENKQMRSMLHDLLRGKNTDDVMDVNAAAEYLKKTPRALYCMVNTKSIPHTKKGGSLYFLKEDLLNWLREGRQTTVSEEVAITRRSTVQLNKK